MPQVGQARGSEPSGLSGKRCGPRTRSSAVRTSLIRNSDFSAPEVRFLGVLPEDNFKYAFRDGLAALIKTGEVYDPANDPNGLEWERDIGLIVVRPLPVYMSEG